jgi:translation initiation factor 2 subunit 2
MTDSEYRKLLKKFQDKSFSRTINDDRFKLPEIEIFYEGNTTVIRNFDKISDAVNRDQDHILKILLGSIGTAGEINKGRLIFQGKIPSKSIQDKMKEYIDTFVMCSECNRPDTHLVKQGRTILIRCDACGAFRSVKSRKKKVITQSSEKIKEGSILDLTVKDIGRKGDGVAYFDKYTIYITGGVKGSMVKVKIEKISGSVAFGRIITV